MSHFTYCDMCGKVPTGGNYTLLLDRNKTTAFAGEYCLECGKTLLFILRNYRSYANDAFPEHYKTFVKDVLREDKNAKG